MRGFNESILIAEQIPTELVSGAIGNTYFKVMHWLEEKSSFDLFSDVMNLNKQQREYARTLPTGQAIVRGLNARPILVQITNYLDQFQNADDSSIIDDSDQAVKNFMKGQLTKWEMNITSQIEVPQALAQGNQQQGIETKAIGRQEQLVRTSQWFFSLPMQTCVFCEMLNRTNKCVYKKNVEGDIILGNFELKSESDEIINNFIIEEDPSKCMMIYDQLLVAFRKHFFQYSMNMEVKDSLGHFYCYLAHQLNPVLINSMIPFNKLPTTMKGKINKLLLCTQKNVCSLWIVKSRIS